MSQKTWAAATVTFVLGALSYGCTSGGIGDPCTPEDEYQAGFNSYAVTEANIESRSFQCETRLCLVNHFQGRVSCPYGQWVCSATNCPNPPPGGPPMAAGTVVYPDLFSDKYPRVSMETIPAEQQCHIPGTSEPITVSVRPQLTARTALNNVYCSCRCAGADPNARYCKCPSGFECSEVLTGIERLGSKELAGSYCIIAGSAYTTAPVGGCDGKAPTAECGNFNGDKL